jgi:hypothetical protein
MGQGSFFMRRKIYLRGTKNMFKKAMAIRTAADNESGRMKKLVLDWNSRFKIQERAMTMTRIVAGWRESNFFNTKQY